MNDQYIDVPKSDRDEDKVDLTMKFRLIYDGLLLGSNQRNTRAKHKHEIRQQLHPQLRRLWTTNKFLREKVIPVDSDGAAEYRAPDGKSYWGSPEEGLMIDVLADRYSMFGYRFVPLVREEISVSCALDILFLRRDPPGSVLQSGDIDNRLKTFFDALRLPHNKSELGGIVPRKDVDDPFFCLMEDDKLITSVSVETDTLLDPLEDHNANWTRLVVTVEIRPYYVTMFNLSFA